VFILFQVQPKAIIVMGEMKFLDPDQEMQKVLFTAPIPWNFFAFA
jgi:hypothetical protein